MERNMHYDEAGWIVLKQFRGLIKEAMRKQGLKVSNFQPNAITYAATELMAIMPVLKDNLHWHILHTAEE